MGQVIQFPTERARADTARPSPEEAKGLMVAIRWNIDRCEPEQLNGHREIGGAA